MDHMPNYEPDENTRYKVRIETCRGVVWIKHRMTLAGCQKSYIELRNAFASETGHGASGFGEGHVFDNYGQHVARISYNGRIWEPLPWHPGMQPVAEAPEVRHAA